jgi:hypothetical protein
MVLSMCGSTPEVQVVNDTLMDIIGGEERIQDHQLYVSYAIELTRMNNTEKNIETIRLTPESKGILTGITETEKGEKMVEISFGDTDGLLPFFKSDNEGKYYLQYHNGEIIQYGANEYKVFYYYRAGERPYLCVKIDRQIYNAEGRPVKNKTGTGAGFP